MFAWIGSYDVCDPNALWPKLLRNITWHASCKEFRQLREMGLLKKKITFAYQLACYLFLFLLCHEQNCNKLQKTWVQYSIIILYWPNFFSHAYTYGMTTTHHGVIVFTIETSHREPNTKRTYKRSSGWNIPSIPVLKVHIVIYLNRNCINILDETSTNHKKGKCMNLVWMYLAIIF
jgi:hypothetical protein